MIFIKKILVFFIIILLINLLYFKCDFQQKFIYPTKFHEISSSYGNRILNSSINFHAGIDFLAPQNSEVYASESGSIVFANFSSDGYGNTIIIKHDDEINSLYSHLSENFIVEVGDYVKKGELIGYVGPLYLSNGKINGNSTGPHLHFSIFINNAPIDPLEMLKKIDVK